MLEEAVFDLRVVSVDLTRTLRRVQHEGVLRINGLEQPIDGRVGNAFGLGNGSRHETSLPSVKSDIGARA